MPKPVPFRHLAHVAPVQSVPITFFTVVTHDRRRLLANRVAHHLLCAIWEQSGNLNGWRVGDYMLMPDHVHLFARPTAEADLMSRWLGMWKSVSARQLVRTLGVKPPIWQQEYFDRFLRSDESYADKWMYVR